MRPVLLSIVVIPCLACLGLFSRDNFEREACDAYLACLAEVDPAGFATATSLYGVGGSCWESAPDSCEQACSTAQAAVVEIHESNLTCNPGWQPEPFRPQSGLYDVDAVIESDTCFGEMTDLTRTWDVQAAGGGHRIRDIDAESLDWRCDRNDRDFDCLIQNEFRADGGGTVAEEVAIDARWSTESSFEGVLEFRYRCVSGNCSPYPSACAFTYDLLGAAQ